MGWDRAVSRSVYFAEKADIESASRQTFRGARGSLPAHPSSPRCHSKRHPCSAEELVRQTRMAESCRNGPKRATCKLALGARIAHKRL